MTTPVSSTTTTPIPPQSNNDVLDRIEAKAKLPQDAASTTPPVDTQDSTALGTANLPTMPPPPPMSEAEMSLLVSQMQTKVQDQSFAVTQSRMEQLNDQRKAMDNKVYSAIQKMDAYKQEADKLTTAAELGLNKAHGKFAHTLGHIVSDLSVGGIVAQVEAAKARKKAGDASADEAHDQAAAMKVGKQMKNAESQLKNVASALSQTASITSEMQDSSATAQDKILRGLQNQV